MLGCLSLLAGCSYDYTDAAKAQDPCTQYQQLVDSIATLRGEDPLTVRVPVLRKSAQEVQSELDDFQALSDGLFESALSTLRADVIAIEEAAVKNGTESLGAARPLIKDSFEDLDEAWAVVQDVAGTECDTGT